MYACIVYAPGQVSFLIVFALSQVVLLTPSRLKSILSHFSSSASQFSTNKVTPKSACNADMESEKMTYWFFLVWRAIPNASLTTCNSAVKILALSGTRMLNVL